MIFEKLHIACAAAVTILAVACGGSTDQTGTSEPPGQNPPAASTSGTTPGGGGTPASDKPEFAISCKGDIEKKSLSLDLSLSPQCKPNDVGCPERCKAFDVSFWYAPPAYRCMSTTIYAWDGTQCVPHPTGAEGGSLHCKGVDCQRIFKTKEDCDAFATACLAR